MRLKMMVGLSGSAICLQPNDEHDFDDDEAVRLIKAGYAVPVAGPVLETATVAAAPETRAKPSKGKRK